MRFRQTKELFSQEIQGIFIWQILCGMKLESSIFIRPCLTPKGFPVLYNSRSKTCSGVLLRMCQFVRKSKAQYC